MVTNENKHFLNFDLILLSDLTLSIVIYNGYK